MSDLLEIKNVTKIFPLGGIIRKKYVTAVENVSLKIPEDKQVIITLAGESGSGKTTIANMVMGFIKPTSGEILFRGKNIWKMSKKERKRYRKEVQAVFQDPFESLNPFYKIRYVLMGPIKKLKLANSQSEADKLAREALLDVNLDPDEVLDKYPHQLSGGQRQRVMLARVFLIKPKLLIADEPVSMIDVSLRADILKIIHNLEKEYKMSCLYITHDLSTAFSISNFIMILYLGSVTEEGDFETVVKDPKHPYVRMLINSIPLPNPRSRWKGRVKLQDIEIARLEKISGCKFHNRCPEAMPICSKEVPPLIDLNEHHKVACHLYTTT